MREGVDMAMGVHSVARYDVESEPVSKEALVSTILAEYARD
jgi:hypothetical protein